MRRLAVLCSFASALAAALPAAAQGDASLMQTPDCLAARKQLDAAFAAGGPRARIDAAREYAAVKCFGVKRPPPPENRFVPPPVSGDPIRLRPEQTLPAVPASPPLPAIAIPRAPVITTCDPAGCWDSNGTRYNQQGPMLLGPSGVCTPTAGLLNCP